MTIRWITPHLGTGPALQVHQEAGMKIIDVRDLVDKAGNRSDSVRQKLIEGCDSLRAGNKTLVCCDYGISRSNAVAVGILAMYESIPFEAAVRRVLEATGEREIKVAPLQAVRWALGVEKKHSHHQKRRVLVTGASGTLGKPVSQKLAEAFEVFTPSRSELNLELGSTQLDLLVGDAEIDCIVHLANPRIFTSNTALGDTLTMLRNILDVCVVRSIKLIYLSSFEVYSGYRTSYLLADEALPLLPKGSYGETKYLAEMLIKHCRQTQGLQCIMLRSSPVYGVGSDRPRFIYNFIDKIKHSQRILTHRYNNGLPALDLLYIDDLVSAVTRAVNYDFCGDFNIGTSVITSTEKIAEILRELIGGKIAIDSVAIDDDTACIAMNSRLATEKIGWQATIGINKGLQKIVRVYPT
ncbi:MAG: NAD-dependent epimerase/dehydratase family protein [Snowella sp.]|nr:NAD-dependent epimerase/dehydratase family protein [Snowella sp.]